jgi:glycosyltransferase involved in cell wall biosynthesis
MKINKVILYTSEFPPLYGGIGNQAYNLADFFYRKGIEIEVITHHRGVLDGEEIEFDRKLNYKVRRNLHFKIDSFTYAFRVLASIINLSKTKNVYIIASGKFPIYLIGFLSMFFTKNKYLAIIHGSEINVVGFLGKLLMKRSIIKFHKVITVSNFTNNILLNLVPKVKSVVINNGFTMKGDKLEKLGNKLPGYPNLVTVGSMSKRKGQHNVIMAIPEMLKTFPTLHYHVIGIPVELERLKNLAIGLNVIDNVTLHGALNDTQVKEIYNSTDVFMMLSENLANGEVEGFGIAILEANSRGIPAIGSKNSGIADAISNFETGRLVDPHNPSQISNALIEIINNYERFSKNAEVWSEKFNWEVIGQKYLDEMLDQ